MVSSLRNFQNNVHHVMSLAICYPIASFGVWGYSMVSKHKRPDLPNADLDASGRNDTRSQCREKIARVVYLIFSSTIILAAHFLIPTTYFIGTLAVYELASLGISSDLHEGKEMYKALAFTSACEGGYWIHSIIRAGVSRVSIIASLIAIVSAAYFYYRSESLRTPLIIRPPTHTIENQHVQEHLSSLNSSSAALSSSQTLNF